MTTPFTRFTQALCILVITLLFPLLVHAQPVPEYDRVYQIKNRNSGKLLEIRDGSMNQGAPAQQWDYNGTAAQQWFIRGYGSYKLVNRASGRTLTYPFAFGNGTVPTQQQTTSSDSPTNASGYQKWVLSGFSYNNHISTTQIRSITPSDYVLEIDGSSTDNGAAAQIWENVNIATQQWEIIDITNNYTTSTYYPGGVFLEQGVYTITNANSGKTLEIQNSTSNNGEPAQQWGTGGATTQQWTFEVASYNNNYTTYRIRNRNSGLYLEIDGSSLGDGARAQQWEYAALPTQEWRLEYLPNGNTLIRNINSNKVLEIVDSSTNDGARAQQWNYVPNVLTQQWKIQFKSYTRGVATSTTTPVTITPDILLLPNPANDIVTVKSSTGKKLTFVQVNDVRGSVISLLTNLVTGQLDISSLPEGIYIITASDGLVVHKQKLVKQ